MPFDRCQNHNWDQAACAILLVGESLVSGEKDFKAIVLGTPQKLAVFQSRPTLVAHCEYLVISEMGPESVRKILVEQDFHETACLRRAWANSINR